MLKKLVFLIIITLFSISLSAQEKEKDTVSVNDSISVQLSKKEVRKQRRAAKKDSSSVIKQEKEKDTVSVNDSISVQLSKKEIKKQGRVAKKDSLSAIKKEYNPLSPSKAAFYSAVLPGLGQIYNKRYWKVPIVFGAIGTGVYFYINNTNEYNRYRDAFKSRLAGFKNDEFYGVDGNGNPPEKPSVSDDALRDAQEFYQKNRDLSLLITVGLYALNIIDANVDAHLKQYNVNEDLTFRPILFQNQTDFKTNVGISLTYNF